MDSFPSIRVRQVVQQHRTQKTTPEGRSGSAPSQQSPWAIRLLSLELLHSSWPVLPYLRTTQNGKSKRSGDGVAEICMFRSSSSLPPQLSQAFVACAMTLQVGFCQIRKPLFFWNQFQFSLFRGVVSMWTSVWPSTTSISSLFFLALAGERTTDDFTLTSPRRLSPGLLRRIGKRLIFSIYIYLF